MADENEEYGYDPGTSESNSEPAYQEPYQDESQPAPQESVNTSNEEIAVPDEYGAVPAEEAAPPPEEDQRSWVRDLVDYTRSLFGINEEAVPTGTEGEGDAAPQKPADEAIPDDMGAASFDRKTGTAGGVRSQPREATQYDQPAENARATGNVERAGATAAAVGKNLFGAEQPEAGDTMKRLKEYVLGEGGMPNAERKAREAQFAANAGNQNMTKSDVREGALKQAAMEGMDKGSAMLQNYRVNQQNFRGLAAAALDHNDREGASKLWNEGHSFVPDGAHAIASPSANGVIMAVRNSATGDTTSTMLTDNQFRDMLHNRSGEFDHLTDQGLQKMIEQVARTPGMPAPTQQPGGEMPGGGVENLPAGANVPGQVGPTAAPAAPMQGAGVANMPQGASVPQVGVQSAQPSETPLPQPNPVREGVAPAAARPAAPAAPGGITRPDGSKFSLGAVDPKYGRDVKGADGWPAGVPRGGSFANVKGSAVRDFSTPIGFGKSGHVNSQGPAGSKPVYDVRGHTYDVDPKTGLPKPQQGQPGWNGPQQGQRNWNGTPDGKYNDPGGPRPQVIQRQPYAQVRANDRVQATSANQAANRDLKREQGNRSLDLKERDLERKNTQGGTRLDQSGQRLDQGNRRLDQGDRSRDQRDQGMADRKDRYSQQDAAKAADRVQRMDTAAMRDATATLNTKYKQDGKLSPDDAALADAIRQKAYDAATKQGGGAPAAGGGQPSAGAGEWRINKAGESKWFPAGQ